MIQKNKNFSYYLQYGIVIIIFVTIIGMAVFFTIDEPRYDLILASKQLLIKSFFSTIYISIITLIFAMIFGFILFIMLNSKIVIIRAFAEVFNEIIMGTPLLIMIFLIVYPFGKLIGSTDKLFLGILAMILYNSPYIANAYQSTSAVITKDQYTVMDLYQFKPYQKYIYIIIPQMIKPFIPSLVNNLSSVIKSSALLNIISISEISYTTMAISSKNYAVIEGYYIMWLMYLLVTIPLSIIAKYVSKKLGGSV